MAVWRTQVVQTYRTPGGPGYSTLHFRHDGLADDLEEDLTLAQTALINALANMVGWLPTSTRWQTSGVWQDVDGDSEVTTDRATVNGSQTSTLVLPGNVAICLGWRTESRSRSGRGRTFLSGFGLNATEDGTPTSTLLTAANDAVDELAAWNAGFANGAWCVLSRTDNISRDITGGSVRDVFASLRSRRD